MHQLEQLNNAEKQCMVEECKQLKEQIHHLKYYDLKQLPHSDTNGITSSVNSEEQDASTETMSNRVLPRYQSRKKNMTVTNSNSWFNIFSTPSDVTADYEPPKNLKQQYAVSNKSNTPIKYGIPSKIILHV